MSTVKNAASLATPDFTVFNRMYIRSTLLLNRFIQTMTTLSIHVGASISAASADNSDGDSGAKVISKGLQAFRTVFESYRFLL